MRLSKAFWIDMVTSRLPSCLPVFVCLRLPACHCPCRHQPAVAWTCKNTFREPFASSSPDFRDLRFTTPVKQPTSCNLHVYLRGGFQRCSYAVQPNSVKIRCLLRNSGLKSGAGQKHWRIVRVKFEHWLSVRNNVGNPNNPYALSPKTCNPNP